ncbi:hypothetical protein EVAR_24996_1 [Eumeta japonica]|uniref:Uncharacterized protein n=1 Tax=Eumeta variegata TaxID=151549 RepID=A0A4C1XG25_EUMVA|nr:hypothetical protein EVAR_24996_1 [Eumeta japonica]
MRLLYRLVEYKTLGSEVGIERHTTCVRGGTSYSHIIPSEAFRPQRTCTITYERRMPVTSACPGNGCARQILGGRRGRARAASRMGRAEPAATVDTGLADPAAPRPALDSLHSKGTYKHI